MQPIPWLISSEILPQEALANGGSAATVVNWGSNFLVAMTFGPMSNALGNFSFAPNAVVLVGFIWYLSVHMPETKGKSLDEIQRELHNKGVKRDDGLGHSLVGDSDV